jgi:putative membrane protein insertion efficiency factor
MAGVGSVDTSRVSLLRRVWGWRVLPLLAPIWLYKRMISPVLPPACRHYPTCSEYAMEAIKQRGIVQGLIMGTWRVLRCNPWGTSGYDPVEAFRWPWQPKCEEPHIHDDNCRHTKDEA